MGGTTKHDDMCLQHISYNCDCPTPMRNLKATINRLTKELAEELEEEKTMRARVFAALVGAQDAHTETMLERDAYKAALEKLLAYVRDYCDEHADAPNEVIREARAALEVK